MKKVLVLKGGFSSEREVSLICGKNIVSALKTKGYDVVEHDLRDGYTFFKFLQKEKPDVVFNALYGNFGEDGEIQGFLDILQIPYTHSGVRACVLGMNKVLTKEFAIKYGIQTPPYEKLTYAEFKKRGTKFEMPYVIKPQSDGSSVGVFIVKSHQDLKKVCYEDEDRELLVEKYIPGRELTVCVLNDKPCAVTELKPKTDFYDYEAKYTDGMTMHILPADLPTDVYQRALDCALKIHRALGCNGISRSDFRYNEKDGLMFLEINVNPGMTSLSLVPEQARYVGISYEDLCSSLVEKAQCRRIK